MHRGTRVTKQVDHAFYPVSEGQKERLLLEVLHRVKPTKTLVFTSTREGTSTLGLALRKRGHEVVSLSSLLSQANRERALDSFRRGEFDVLVATDVAARGLDIMDIDLVVNFDVPMHAEDYVHRIGRTGRAKRTGKAVTLVMPFDERRAADIERLLGYEVKRVELEGFAYDRRPAPERRPGRRPDSGRQRSGRSSAGRGKRGGRGKSG